VITVRIVRVVGVVIGRIAVVVVVVVALGEGVSDVYVRVEVMLGAEEGQVDAARALVYLLVVAPQLHDDVDVEKGEKDGRHEDEERVENEHVGEHRSTHVQLTLRAAARVVCEIRVDQEWCGDEHAEEPNGSDDQARVVAIKDELYLKLKSDV
jgi:hypothetical protein